MKISSLALTTALATLAATTNALSLFDPNGEGLDTLLHDHQWCCTDAWCCESCMFPGVTPGIIVPAQGVRFCSGGLCPNDVIFSDEKGDCTRRETHQGMSHNPPSDCAERLCKAKFNYQCRPHGSICKDPHILKWDGQWYDFHGECDMLFLRAPYFADGVGLEVYIRTKIQNDYSYIESAVVRIGNDVLEVSSFGEYFYNGVDTAALPQPMGPYTVIRREKDVKETTFTIDTHQNQTIEVKAWKHMVDVRVNRALFQDFVDSSGMMGSFPYGGMVDRNGRQMTDEIEFGMEWQLRDDEPQLFQSVRAPQYPQKCIMPDPNAVATLTKRRRLGEGTGVTQEQAEAACGHHHGKDATTQREMCIYDVLATGDLELADAGAY